VVGASLLTTEDHDKTISSVLIYISSGLASGWACLLDLL
jgi:hypothetical protein